MVRRENVRVALEIYPGLRRFAATVGSADLEPDDLVQEALRRTLQSHALSDLSDPSSYVRVVILNLARNGARKRGRELAATRRAAQNSIHMDAYPSDLQLLDELSPAVRAALYLTAVEGLSTAEVAQMLDVSEVAVRLRVFRGRHHLRRLPVEDGGNAQ